MADIEIDVFSGRPNPRVELRGQQARRLKDLLELKREPMRAAHADAGLGFRGFLVRLEPSSMDAYRVVGDTLVIGAEAFYDPHREAQDYIVSVLPPAMRMLVDPFLGSRR